MKPKVILCVFVLFFLIAAITGAYPIDSTVVTTVNRTVHPVAVPSDSGTIFPYEVSKYSENGYGLWKFGEGLGYERRTDLMPSDYSNASETNSARLLRFFDMTDVHITDKETPTQAIFYGYKGGQSSGYSPVMLSSTHVLDAAVQTINALHKVDPFDFGIALGDVANNEQYNDLDRYVGFWFERITCKTRFCIRLIESMSLRA